jgi:hypothetical protein
MKKYFLSVLVAVGFLSITSKLVRAQGNDATEILNKAIKALGGEEKLSSASAFTWAIRGTVEARGRPTDLYIMVTFNGLNQVRRQFSTRTDRWLTVLNRDKGWNVAKGRCQAMNDAAIAEEKRSIYRQVIPTLLLPVKSNGFKYEFSGKGEVGGKPASILKITGPDAKDFLLYFDEETSLPVKEVTHLPGIDGKEQVEEVTFGNYRDFDGIKKAVTVDIRTGPSGAGSMEVTHFKILNSVDPQTFAEPR